MREVFLPKEDLSNERHYRRMTCLNTSGKIYTRIVGKYMKIHAGRNNIWDRHQLGTCEGALGIVAQLLVDSRIMNEV